jgi:glucose/arabinose dehydrogenase
MVRNRGRSRRAGTPRYRFALPGALLAIAVTAGCGDGGPETEPTRGDRTPPALAPSPTGDPQLSNDTEVIATGLQVPWGVAFLPDGAALVTERTTGRILQVGPDSEGARLRVTEVVTIDGVDFTGEGGLLGVAVSPEYQDDKTIFVYYTSSADNRIARLTLDSDPEPILTGIPSAGNHNGGRLAFGPDGFLYASTGDAGRPESAQDPDNLAGKILRMTADGEPAPDNPFGNYTWAYGLRNVQGLAWDPAGRLWATEFGDQRWDEINLIEPRNNYGWPRVEGTGDQDPYVDPLMTWRPEEAACSGAAVVGATLVAACLRGQRLWLMELTESGTILGAARPLLVGEYGRLRSAVVAPDGSLWVTTSNRDNRLPGGPGPDDDRIIRVGVASDGAGDTGDGSNPEGDSGQT